jgi:hypothetical protein
LRIEPRAVEKRQLRILGARTRFAYAGSTELLKGVSPLITQVMSLGMAVGEGAEGPVFSIFFVDSFFRPG